MMRLRLGGMRGFYLVAFGQLISLLGTAMTQFGLTLWSWEFVTKIQPVDNPATAIALIGFFNVVPLLLVSPVAGALVDRWDRKLTMMLSDLGAGAATIAVFLLYSSGQLQVWHLYIAAAFTSLFQAFQWPAYSAAIAMIVPKKQYTRANAVMGLTESVAGIFAPVLGAFLLTVIGLGAIMIIDIFSFTVAILTLTLIHIPQPPASEQSERNSLWQDSIFGFRYIFSRPSLLGLQMIFFFGNLLANVSFTLMNLMILSRTSNNAVILSLVQGAFGVGAVIGGLILSLRGGFKKRVHGVVSGWFFSSLGVVLMAVSQTWPLWILFGYLNAAFGPLTNSSNQSIWQAKVPPEMQGRVFSARRLIAWVVGPLGIALAGPLADQVFEPAMRQGGSLVPLFGPLVGVGPGAGMAVIIFITGIGAMGVAVIGYLIPAIREAEERLPDHVVVVEETAG